MVCLLLDVWADRTAQDHGGAGLEPHQEAVSDSVLSEVGRHVAGGTMFLWETRVGEPPFLSSH